MKIIFQKYVYEGYGALRLHRYLMDQGLRTKEMCIRDSRSYKFHSTIILLSNLREY